LRLGRTRPGSGSSRPAGCRNVVPMARSRPALIEFPAEEPERALRFWGGLLGAPLEPRAQGSGGLAVPVDRSARGGSTRADAVRETPSRCPTLPWRISLRYWPGWRCWAEAWCIPSRGGPSARTPRGARWGWPHPRRRAGPNPSRPSRMTTLPLWPPNDPRHRALRRHRVHRSSTADYLAQHAPADIRLSLAGRDREKLAALRSRLARDNSAARAEVPLHHADVDDPASLRGSRCRPVS
jgi:hypothetical protein